MVIKAGGVLDLVERHALGGSPVQMTRRDMRRGKATSVVSRTAEGLLQIKYDTRQRYTEGINKNMSAFSRALIWLD
jgi:hypothetical protein